MSTDYTDLHIWTTGPIAATVSGPILAIPVHNYDILVTGFMVYVSTTASATGLVLNLQTDDGTPVVLATLTLSATQAAKSRFDVKVVESLRLITAGRGVILNVATTASSIVYFAQVQALGNWH